MIQISAAGAAHSNANDALEQALDLAMRSMDSAPDAAVLFTTSDYNDNLPRLAKRFSEATGAGVSLGCNAESVIGPEREYEREPALAVWLASLPGCEAVPFHFGQESLERAENEADWRALLNANEECNTSILLGDPFSLDARRFLDGVNQRMPGLRILGGMASGAMAPGESVLMLNGELYEQGAAGFSLSGAVRVETVISQGCKPVGQPYLITQGERNVIHGLGGRNPMEVAQETINSLPDEDRRLVSNGLFVGRVIDEYKDRFQRGDFLIRNIIGADQESGAIAVMDNVQPGATIQFHLRDADTADEDIRLMLAPHQGRTPCGALAFSCNGRGSRMYPDADHDLGVIQSTLGRPPVAGFFCAGELGPVGGKNFIHGHTASIALFYPPAGRTA
ncbi:MAG: hypothetical protein GC154_21890 [bacterium]|nr:hypothetical protein [bacterium]